MSGNIGIRVKLPDGREGEVRSQEGSTCKVRVAFLHGRGEGAEIVTVDVEDLESDNTWFTKEVLRGVR